MDTSPVRETSHVGTPIIANLKLQSRSFGGPKLYWVTYGGHSTCAIPKTELLDSKQTPVTHLLNAVRHNLLCSKWYPSSAQPLPTAPERHSEPPLQPVWSIRSPSKGHTSHCACIKSTLSVCSGHSWSGQEWQVQLAIHDTEVNLSHSFTHPHSWVN